MKIKKVYLGQRQIRPDTSWNPWAYTVAYYPLKSDFKDYSWKNRDGTSSWSCTFQDNGCYFAQWYVSIPTPTELGTSWVCTFSLWIKEWNPMTWWPYSRWYNKIVGQRYEWNDSKTSFCVWWAWDNGSSTKYQINESSKIFENNKREYVTVTYTWWSTYKVYRNWSLVGTYNYSFNPKNNLWTSNWYINYFNNWWSVNRTLSEIIIESKVRTDQEISDYFNKTKSKYWIS